MTWPEQCADQQFRKKHLSAKVESMIQINSVNDVTADYLRVVSGNVSFRLTDMSRSKLVISRFIFKVKK